MSTFINKKSKLRRLCYQTFTLRSSFSFCSYQEDQRALLKNFLTEKFSSSPHPRNNVSHFSHAIFLFCFYSAIFLSLPLFSFIVLTRIITACRQKHGSRRLKRTCLPVNLLTTWYRPLHQAV